MDDEIIVPVDEGLDVRFAKAMLQLKRRHGLSLSAIDDFAKVLSGLLPDQKLPRSIYMIRKLAAPESFVVKIQCACFYCGVLFVGEVEICVNDSCKSGVAGKVERFRSRGYIWVNLQSQLRAIVEGKIWIFSIVKSNPQVLP